jgi:hypothetical protein
MADNDSSVAYFSVWNFIYINGSSMPYIPIKHFNYGLAVLWGALSASPVAQHIAPHSSHLLLEENAQRMVFVYPTLQHLTRAFLPLGVSISTADQLDPKSNTGLGTRSQDIDHVELQVPKVLVRALLMEDRLIKPVELQIPAALPMVIMTED